MKIQTLFLTLFFFALIPASVRANPVFDWPAACRAGTDCWVVNYVDNDAATKNAQDYACGPRSYDGHDGTDIGLADLVRMENGVDVKAAAAGTVGRLRDGAEDRLPGAGEVETLLAARKGCGNGVVITHDGGWQSAYCHLKKGSIAVKEGQRVEKGDVLAKIGHSGAAEFPHLHFSLIDPQGQMTDPFTGVAPGKAPCQAQGPASGALWGPGQGPAYAPAVIFAAGFKGMAPDIDGLKIDTFSAPDLAAGEAGALVLWAGFFGLAPGDEIRMTIRDPAGQLYSEKTFAQKERRARQYYYSGRRIDGGRKPAPGLYTGTVTLTRPQEGKEPLTLTRESTVKLF